MTAVVVDTNVAIVANGRAAHVPLPCVRESMAAIIRAVREQVIVADRGMRIFTEYRRRLSPSGQPGLGDMFFEHVWLNQANPERCELVDIHPTNPEDNDFEEFPDDPDLVGFDPSDRKFVAAAKASQLAPKILNAADTDWWPYRDCLETHGVQVVFLCPDLMGD